MWNSAMRQPIAFSVTILLLGGCASVPQQLAGTDFTAVSPQQAASQALRGPRVRWGGEIISVETKVDSTCFEVLSRELRSDARPHEHDASEGRFMACGRGFYDPEIYTKGRDLTIVGELAGTEQRNVGEFAYTYAVVDVDNVYLWPEYHYHNYYAYDPWWPYYGYPYWGGGYWWAPPVVVVHPPHH
jgi:outer membrane lipoprotein